MYTQRAIKEQGEGVTEDVELGDVRSAVWERNGAKEEMAWLIMKLHQTVEFGGKMGSRSVIPDDSSQETCSFEEKSTSVKYEDITSILVIFNSFEIRSIDYHHTSFGQFHYPSLVFLVFPAFADISGLLLLLSRRSSHCVPEQHSDLFFT